ncbi:MAG: selenide, water dikinase SelD [Proteobacteria bacterium]|nr:selenide, water dikinase SelD [Pseudomonadota bacterium]
MANESLAEADHGTPPFSLRALAGCGGCAAKASPELVAALAGLVAPAAGIDPALLVGLTPSDDAAVYALDAERALVATVDYFPPLVDDPYDYGAVAAANAVSDVYAMGGSVAFALAIAGFPASVPETVVSTVLRGAAETVRACGGMIVGGHTIRCAEPIFGLCVIGFVHPDRIWRKRGARVGDVLVLSKPLGTGVLLSAREPRYERVAVRSMRTTNRLAADALNHLAVRPSAATDISGYGLLGHGIEMASQSAVALHVRWQDVPLLDGAREVAERGIRTSAHRDSDHSLQPAAVEWGAGVTPAIRALLTDPQTSGGLLATVASTNVDSLMAKGFVAIGDVVERAAESAAAAPYIYVS